MPLSRQMRAVSDIHGSKKQGHRALPARKGLKPSPPQTWSLLADFLGVRKSREGFSVLQMERQTQRGWAYQLAEI